MFEFSTETRNKNKIEGKKRSKSTGGRGQDSGDWGLDERDKLGYKESAGGDSAAEVKALNYDLWIDNACV